MKKILITGANSYIGTSFEKYILENYPQEYTVETVDMTNPSWKEKDFSEFDCVFHVAGIAHIKETKENAKLYYSVNRDLAVETTEKAKNEGVKQFVFLSSMSVYGIETGIINKETVPEPKSNYGKSKLQAEEKILKMCGENFRVAILRPPMVYGKNCKGNFQTVVKLVKKLPVFPAIKNKRSMIYIDNLCEFITLVIAKEKEGLFFPQNKEYVRTDEMAKIIAEQLNKKVFFSRMCGAVIWVFKPVGRIIKKAFGTLVYDMGEEFDYEVTDFKNSVKESV